MPKQKDLSYYDERYKTLYKNDVRFWNEHEPHSLLMEFLTKLGEDAYYVDLGCGEGFEARAIANRGFRVTGIDLSPTVINKAKDVTPEHLNVNFIIGDVTDLKKIGIKDNSVDFVSNIGCLHMMHESEDRMAHLSEIRRILKPGGYFFLQNGLHPDDIEPKSSEEALILKQLKQFTSNYVPGKKIPRKIVTEEGEKEILLPLCPTGKTLFLDEYIHELEIAGFNIIKSQRSGGANMPFEAVIIAMPKS